MSADFTVPMETIAAIDAAERAAMFATGATFGTGGDAWTRTRRIGGEPGNNATIEITPHLALTFLENHLLKDAQSLPAAPIYSAPYWGIASLDLDARVGDVFDNGQIAFLVLGASDTARGFQCIPATLK